MAVPCGIAGECGDDHRRGTPRCHPTNAVLRSGTAAAAGLPLFSLFKGGILSSKPPGSGKCRITGLPKEPRTVTNFRNFDLNLLLVLDGVLREGTLSNAAKALNVSQPTISSSLAKLREILQDELFVRSGNGMQPTPRALALKEPIQRVLAAVKGEILDTVSFDPATEIRPYTVATSDIGETLLLPRVVARLAQDAPSVNLRSTVVGPRHLEDALEAGEVDLAIGYFPDLARPTTMQQTLFKHGFACLARAGHPLIKNGLTLEAFLEAHHVVVTLEGSSQELFEDALARRGFERRCVLRIPHVMSVPFVVARTDLIATVPRAVAAFFSGLVNLQVLDPPIHVPEFAVKQYWHRRFHHDARVAWLRTMISELYQNSWMAELTSQNATNAPTPSAQ
jgi:DNA-binding transcriptional LysR family regulator